MYSPAGGHPDSCKPCAFHCYSRLYTILYYIILPLLLSSSLLTYMYICIHIYIYIYIYTYIYIHIGPRAAAGPTASTAARPADQKSSPGSKQSSQYFALGPQTCRKDRPAGPCRGPERNGVAQDGNIPVFANKLWRKINEKISF